VGDALVDTESLLEIGKSPLGELADFMCQSYLKETLWLNTKKW
jgi:hypothetical protein